MITIIRKAKSIVWKTIAIVNLIITIVVFIILKSNVYIAEWWSRYPARWYINLMGSITKNVPFSLTEVFFVFNIVFTIVLLVLIIRDFIKLKVLSGISKILTIPLIVLTIVSNYIFACGFAYNRKPVELPYYETQVENAKFVDIYNYFVNDMNDCISQLEFDNKHDVKNNLSTLQISKLLESEYDKLTSNYYSSITVNAKPMLFSFLFREFQITGVSFCSFGEANINNLTTKAELPFVIAHEIAHIKGVMREDEANQLAFYICLNSDDPYLRFSSYCLYFYQIKTLTSKSLMTDEDRERINQYDSNYAYCVNHMIDYWKEHDLLTRVGDFFNDLYIKMNGVKEGTESYQGGTNSSVDPTTKKLNASKYQKLFFERYYRLNP